MTDAQMRADIEALMSRLLHTERALLDTRQQIAAVRNASPLVDTRNIGKALPMVHWCPQRLARVMIPIRCVQLRSANPKLM